MNKRKAHKNAFEISAGRREFLKAATVAAFSVGSLVADAKAGKAKSRTPDEKAFHSS